MVIAVDIDNTLSFGESFTDEQVICSTPNTKLIQRINEWYYAGHAIILYTCRGDSIIPATRYWLKIHGVKYHSLSNNKLWAGVYIDDKAITPKQALKLKI